MALESGSSCRLLHREVKTPPRRWAWPVFVAPALCSCLTSRWGTRAKVDPQLQEQGFSRNRIL